MVIRIVNKQLNHPRPGTYEFNCPHCGTTLQADHDDLHEFNGMIRFHCPVCADTRVFPIQLLKKIS